MAALKYSLYAHLTLAEIIKLNKILEEQKSLEEKIKSKIDDSWTEEQEEIKIQIELTESLIDKLLGDLNV